MESIIKCIGNQVAKFINSGGWATCIIIGVLGILMAYMGHFMLIIEEIRKGDFSTAIFMITIDILLFVFIMWVGKNVVNTIKEIKKITDGKCN